MSSEAPCFWCTKTERSWPTAEHVLSDNVNVPLSFFASSGFSRSFGGDFVASEDHDIVVKLLTPDEIDALAHVSFIAEGDLGSAAAQGERFYASVAGYPASAGERSQKRMQGSSLVALNPLLNQLISGAACSNF